MKRWMSCLGAAMIFGLGTVTQAAAEEPALKAVVDRFETALDMLWLILAAVLVFFMQAGFAMVESGLSRAKNAGNIMMKNLMDFSAGAVAFWALGWGLMYGASVSGFIGSDQFFLSGADSALYRDWMFQVVFAATAATIVSGAMAERTKFGGYLIYSVFISALIYPISGHWIWNGGWLAELGFHDFAGSTVVHSVGAWAALVGAFFLGARKGKYVKVEGKIKVRAIPGHSMPLAALGVFILWFGKPDPSMSLNGALAGLVGITAGTWVVSPLGAVIIGLASGVIVVASVEFFDKVLHIDDPVGAVSVHGVCGAWGTLAVGLFADGVNDPSITGLFYGGGAGQLLVQCIGVAAVFAWAVLTAGILFGTLKAAGMLRVDEKEELMGLDIGEHGMESYSGFQIFSNM